MEADFEFCSGCFLRENQLFQLRTENERLLEELAAIPCLERLFYNRPVDTGCGHCSTCEARKRIEENKNREKDTKEKPWLKVEPRVNQEDAGYVVDKEAIYKYKKGKSK